MGGLLTKLKGSGGKENKEPKLIVIFGATGGQGGSVARAFQGDSGYKIRAVTRDPDSDKAKTLSEAGVEVVAANLDEPETVNKAIEGAYGVFAVTNYWEHSDSEREIKQGKSIADACKANNVKHVVFSGLENVKELTGKECPFFDSKAIIEEYMKKDCGLPVTSVRFSFFCQNFLGVNKPTKGEDDDTYILNIPVGDTCLDSVPVSETGECTRQIFKNGKKYIGKSVGYSSHSAPVSEYADILTKHLEGKTVKAGEMTTEQYRELDFPGCEYFANMFEAIKEGKLVRDVAATKALNPKISDFDAWVQTNKEKLLAALE